MGVSDYRIQASNLVGYASWRITRTVAVSGTAGWLSRPSVSSFESRWSVLEHVDAAVLVDAGNVAARAADLDLSRTSYGLGVRLHTSKTTVARFDIARSREGWRWMFRLNDPFRLARLTKRTAAIPFVP
jgi:hypothetical protein